MSKPFDATQIRLNLVDLLQAAADPSAGAGLAAAIGSFYLRSGTGQMWLKTTAPDTGWQKMLQSLNWISIVDYGAVGDGVTDNTAAIQNALNDCNAQGGGVVFVPPGTFCASQLTMNGMSKVQFLGVGVASVIKWQWNAATAAGSLLTINGGSTQCRIRLLRFDGSALTNPAASRENHLVQVGDGVTGAIEIDVWQCAFQAMVANSGDGVHATGANLSRVQRLRVSDCLFDGCSRFSVDFAQGVNTSWIINNYLTNCETEIGCVATVDVNSDGIIIAQNQVTHTSGSVKECMRLEGGATGLINNIICAENALIGGFVTLTNAQRVQMHGNSQTSGAYASATAMFAVSGSVTDLIFLFNFLDRNAATAGYCLSIVRAGGVSPDSFRVGQNLFINEVSGGGFVQIVDCSHWSAGGNLARNLTSAGASTTYAFEVQAVAVAVTDAVIGPGNQFTAAAGSYAGAIRLLVNGSNITNLSFVGCQLDNCDYGLILETGGGGGSFTAGQIMYGGNNVNASVGNINRIGNTAAVRIGLNACTFGPNYWSGVGTPEAQVTARVGSLYSREDGGQATAVYYKDNGTAATGWLGIGGSMLTFGADDLGGGAGTVFLGYGYIGTASATEIQINMTRSGTIRNLRIQVATAGTGVDTVTVTVRKNGVDTALTTSIANTSTGGATDLVDSFTFVAGDLISFKVVKGASVVTGQKQFCASAELV